MKKGHGEQRQRRRTKQTDKEREKNTDLNTEGLMDGWNASVLGERRVKDKDRKWEVTTGTREDEFYKIKNGKIDNSSYDTSRSIHHAAFPTS